MATTIRFTLFSAKEIEKAKQQLIEYQEDLNEKLDLFVQKLCEKGVEIAKEKVSVHDAIDTGELLNSIDLREGDIIKNGSQWFIYTNCDYAKFIEFGTGVVGAGGKDRYGRGGETYPGELPSNWAYASGSHIFTTKDGITGWYYFKNGNFHFTEGQPSKPFMYETSVELREQILEVAKEVFGGASDDISD